jgi:hypothetical protein
MTNIGATALMPLTRYLQNSPSSADFPKHAGVRITSRRQAQWLDYDWREVQRKHEMHRNAMPKVDQGSRESEGK